MYKNFYYLKPSDYQKLQGDEEGLYSISKPNAAIQINTHIQQCFPGTNIETILDCTGGIGGNTIFFASIANAVTSCEVNLSRYRMLRNNVNLYEKFRDKINCLNISSLEILYNEIYCYYDVIFMDPPWGGTDYKKNPSIKLCLGDVPIENIAKHLLEQKSCKVLMFKLPIQYQMDDFNKLILKFQRSNERIEMIERNISKMKLVTFIHNLS